MLEQKEPKIQERLIAQPRTRSGHHTWVATLQLVLQMKNKGSIYYSELSLNHKGYHLGALG